MFRAGSDIAGNVVLRENSGPQSLLTWGLGQDLPLLCGSEQILSPSECKGTYRGTSEDYLVITLTDEYIDDWDGRAVEKMLSSCW